MLIYCYFMQISYNLNIIKNDILNIKNCHKTIIYSLKNIIYIKIPTIFAF